VKTASSAHTPDTLNNTAKLAVRLLSPGAASHDDDPEMFEYCRLSLKQRNGPISQSAGGAQFPEESELSLLSRQELARRLLIGTAEGPTFQSMSTSSAAEVYKVIFDDPGPFRARQWKEIAAERLFTISLNNGNFKQAEFLLPYVHKRANPENRLVTRRELWCQEKLIEAHNAAQAGELARARNILIALESTHPGEQSVLCDLLHVLRRLGERKRAEPYAQKLRELPLDPRSWNAIGEIELMQGDLEAATRTFGFVHTTLSALPTLQTRERKLFAVSVNHLAEIALMRADCREARALFSQRIDLGQIIAGYQASQDLTEREFGLAKHAFTKRGFAELLDDDAVAARVSFEAALALDPLFHHAKLGAVLVSDSWRAMVQDVIAAIDEAHTLRVVAANLDPTQGDPLIRLDLAHVYTLAGIQKPSPGQIDAQLSQVEDRGKLMLLAKRLECSARRFPANTELQAMLARIAAALNV
jgi:tetratricopeptide (TPR) repeat protein